MSGPHVTPRSSKNAQDALRPPAEEAAGDTHQSHWLPSARGRAGKSPKQPWRRVQQRKPTPAGAQGHCHSPLLTPCPPASGHCATHARPPHPALPGASASVLPMGTRGRVPEAVHPSDAPSGRTFAESLGSKATASPARCPAPPGAAGRPRTRGAEPRGGHVGPQEPHLVPTWSPPPRLLPAGVWGETRAQWAGREQLPPPPGRER